MRKDIPAKLAGRVVQVTVVRAFTLMSQSLRLRLSEKKKPT